MILKAESYALRDGKPDDVFYTNMSDRNITAKANYYKRKVKTERAVIITGTQIDPVANSILKVTIID